LELARRMKFRPNPRSRYVPTPETEHMILEWVRQWGLLGILPVRYEIITLPPGRTFEGQGLVATIRKAVNQTTLRPLLHDQTEGGPVPKFPKTRATVESSPPTQAHSNGGGTTISDRDDREGCLGIL
jgi:hypothetical protein